MASGMGWGYNVMPCLLSLIPIDSSMLILLSSGVLHNYHVLSLGWANHADPDQTAPIGAVRSWSTLFAIFMPRHKKWRGIMLYPPNF